MADKTLDAKGLNCPLPILKTKKMLNEVPAGGTLEVLATDPGSVADMASFCRTTGNELLELDEGWRRFPFRDQAHRLNLLGRLIDPARWDIELQRHPPSGRGRIARDPVRGNT